MSMFGCSCCGMSFGIPCCISYTKPLYAWVEYTPGCEENDPWAYHCKTPRLEKIADIPVMIRYCGLSAGCYVKKVTENYKRSSFSCPDYEYEIIRYTKSNYCFPGEDLGQGITCPTPYWYSESSSFLNRTIEKVYGKSDPQYSCWSNIKHQPFPWYIKQTTQEGITIDPDWYGWWEEFCPQDCKNCDGIEITQKCNLGGYTTFSTEEKSCDNYCILATPVTSFGGGITQMGITYSFTNDMVGKYYSVNNKEWINGPYCYGADCLVSFVGINFVAPYGISGTTSCDSSDWNNCFLSVNTSEDYKMPNPKDTHSDNIYGACEYLLRDPCPSVSGGNGGIAGGGAVGFAGELPGGGGITGSTGDGGGSTGSTGDGGGGGSTGSTGGGGSTGSTGDGGGVFGGNDDGIIYEACDECEEGEGGGDSSGLVF